MLSKVESIFNQPLSKLCLTVLEMGLVTTCSAAKFWIVSWKFTFHTVSICRRRAVSPLPDIVDLGST